MIKIIVDSICDLPKHLLDEYDIKVMPLNVILNDVVYRDGVDIQVEDVYDQMRQGVVPKTSQISPEVIYEVFGNYYQSAQDFIYLAFSSVLSGSCNLARVIQKELQAEYPNVRTEVVDSKSGSLGIGLIALQAAKMAQKGYDFQTILGQIDFMIKHVEHILAISDLSWLVKGGRIAKIIGKTGSILDIRPILEIHDGHLKVIGAARGNRKMLNSVAELVMHRIKDFPEQLVGIGHSEDFMNAKNIERLLKEKCGLTHFVIDKIGCVLGTHLGIGGIGVLFFNKKPELYIE